MQKQVAAPQKVPEMGFKITIIEKNIKRKRIRIRCARKNERLLSKYISNVTKLLDFSYNIHVYIQSYHF